MVHNVIGLTEQEKALLSLVDGLSMASDADVYKIQLMILCDASDVWCDDTFDNEKDAADVADIQMHLHKALAAYTSWVGREG